MYVAGSHRRTVEMMLRQKLLQIRENKLNVNKVEEI